MVEGRGFLQVSHVQMHVTHCRACRHSVPRRVASPRDDALDIKRIGCHHELPFDGLPHLSGTIGVDLDAESVWIVEIERLAHLVIRHADAHVLRREVREEPPERSALGQQDREVKQPEGASPGHRSRARDLVQCDQRRLRARCAERGGVGRGRDRAEPDHVRVVRQRPLQVRHLEPHATHPRRVGQAESGGRDAERGRRCDGGPAGHEWSPVAGASVSTCRYATFDAAWRTASISISRSTRSPTMTPPVSSAWFQVSPKSPRLIDVFAENAARSLPQGSLACPPRSTVNATSRVMPLSVSSPTRRAFVSPWASNRDALNVISGYCATSKKSADFKCASRSATPVSMLDASITASTDARVKSSPGTVTVPLHRLN